MRLKTPKQPTPQPSAAPAAPADDTQSGVAQDFSDPETADLEADLIAGNQNKNTGGDELIEPAGDAEATPPADEPIDGTETDLTEPTGDDTADVGQEEGDPKKAVQKLTGKLGQKIRDSVEEMESEDLKYVLNSIISAIDMTKLSPEDKEEVLGKFEDNESEDGEEANVEMNEIDNDHGSMDEDGDDGIVTILKNPLVSHILSMADLKFEMENEPEATAYDFCEAAQIFMKDHKQTASPKFLNDLNEIIKSCGYRKRENLNSFNDLEITGDMIYDAMIMHNQEHVRENTLNEQRLLEVMRRIKNKIKN